MGAMDLKVNLRRTDDGLADVRCGRGGCGELLGDIHWAGMNMGVGRYSGPPMFQPLPGFRRRKDDVLALTTRSERQRRNLHRIRTQPGSQEPVAWGRREAKDVKHRPWEETTAAAVGQSSGTSPLRLAPIDPLPPPIRIKCPLPKCGLINRWDGIVPS